MTPDTAVAYASGVLIPVLALVGKQWMERRMSNVAADRDKDKNSYDIWKDQWERIVGQHEKQIASLRLEVDGTREELENTREELRTLHVEHAAVIAAQAECARKIEDYKRRMKAAGIPNGDD